ncbi:class I adenylate-forming enzyme family protein [Streptomyces clavuligerus]|uniref:Putative Acyl-CoA synthetases AMP-forming /AMP-acid ligases II n=1 Tax=Streptomyces clavuligerus TaxID=1901 RepID=B5GQ13_STRCL|nr:class I adenylate-forming enzyme family protein [Streptomyces clavuligerus]ANW19741.1 acyl-CoA synthetase [Streptomyces clavuligerus]AXU14355.1 long-chain fatty acid--CoA ligase [Streptomyces clavuligerus]EDY48409.1 AMP-dependent synthetase and ligase [Streptomyces clavuligerus]EFG07415.1 Putative Acyl-CoA synthetases AMP-forming /AMP-acid ligases II [Streptomyces clavuligerus]MBY6304358.1 acyl--CoA ligase [Streptomyces clavuligerus]
MAHPRDHEAALCAPGAPFAVTRGEDGVLVYATGPRTLREFMEPVHAFGDRPFLIGERTTCTYGEFFAASCALARRFHEEYGLRRGDRVALAMRNHPEWQVAFWATQLAGLVSVPLNAWWTEEELTYALDDCTPRLLLVDGERLPRVDAWRRANGARTIVFHAADAQVPPAVERYEEFGAADPGTAPPAVEVRPEDDSMIMYTSGTTGQPKGAVATQLAMAGAARNPLFYIAAAALAKGAVPGAEPPPVTLMTFPFFHVAAFSSLVLSMAVGGSLVLMRKWDAERALDLIVRHQATGYAGVPTTALQLLDAADRRGGGLETLNSLGTGGAPAPPDLVGRLTARFGEQIVPRNGYGLTETSGGVMAGQGDEYRREPGCVGRPAPAVEARIAGPDGEPLPEGGIGELWLRGQSLMRGYWKNERATADAFRDGWFRTGDLAVMDEGRVTIVDRLKDMVIRGGENVYCAEVEGVLHGHPDVEDAAVFGVPHPQLGEEVAAVVQLRAGAGAGEAELREYAGGRLAAFKVPAHVVFGDVPRNPTGKILKRELRKDFFGLG